MRLVRYADRPDLLEIRFDRLVAQTFPEYMAVVVVMIRSAAWQWSPGARFAAEVAAGAVSFLISIYILERNRLGVLREFIRTIRS